MKEELEKLIEQKKYTVKSVGTDTNGKTLNIIFNETNVAKSFVSESTGTKNVKVTISTAPTFRVVERKHSAPTPLDDRSMYEKRRKVEGILPGMQAQKNALPVMPVQHHKMVLYSLCLPCLEESNRNIKLNSSGKEYITTVMCPPCVRRNIALDSAFR